MQSLCRELNCFLCANSALILRLCGEAEFQSPQLQINPLPKNGMVLEIMPVVESELHELEIELIASEV